MIPPNPLPRPTLQTPLTLSGFSTLSVGSLPTAPLSPSPLRHSITISLEELISPRSTFACDQQQQQTLQRPLAPQYSTPTPHRSFSEHRKRTRESPEPTSTPTQSRGIRRRLAPPPTPSPSSSAECTSLTPITDLHSPTALHCPPPFPFSFSPLESIPQPPSALGPPIDMSALLYSMQPNYLSARVELVFDNDALVDMIGGPDTGTSYSLAGHVVVALHALPTSMEGKIREVQSLIIRLEGRSEFFQDQLRYTPMRLHASELVLASPEKPLLVPAQDPLRLHSSTIRLAIPFDLRLPGWLPSSHSSVMTNTAYGAIADVRIGWLDAPPSATPCRRTLFENLSLNPAASVRSHSKFTEFKIRRHRFPVGTDGRPRQISARNFCLKPSTSSPSPVECIVTVPEWVDVNGGEKSLRLSLRLRARPLVASMLGIEVEEDPDMETATSRTSWAGADGSFDADDSHDSEFVATEESVPPRDGREKKATRTHPLRIIELGMEVEEIERYSSSPVTAFVASFPIPEEQPTRYSSEHALISPPSPYAENGFLGAPKDDKKFRTSRSRQCLLADDGNQRNFTFDDGGLPLADKWRRVNVVLPMPAHEKHSEVRRGERPQPETENPFLRINHNLKIRIICRSIDPEPTDTVVILTTPIRFGTCPSTMPDATPKPSLPAYLQLFHENGDLRECDPLPLYSKPTSEVVAPSNYSPPIPDYKSLYPDSPSASSSRASSPTPSGVSATTGLSSAPLQAATETGESMDVDESAQTAWPQTTINTTKHQIQRSSSFVS